MTNLPTTSAGQRPAPDDQRVGPVPICSAPLAGFPIFQHGLIVPLLDLSNVESIPIGD